MCGRLMYCKTCKLALEIRLCSVTSSLLPWLGSHALSSAMEQRSSGAAAILVSPRVGLQTLRNPPEKQVPQHRDDRVKLEESSPGWDHRLPSLSSPDGCQDRNISSGLGAGTPLMTLSVGHIRNHAKGEQRLADEHPVGIHAIDILARNHGPLDLVVVAAAADKRNVVHAGKRVRNLRTVEEDGARSQVGMDADVKELLRELVPVLCNTGATQQSCLIVIRSGATRQGETEERNAAGSNDLLVNVARFLRVEPDFRWAETLVVPEPLERRIDFDDAVRLVGGKSIAVERSEVAG